jgi:hypothetical protein
MAKAFNNNSIIFLTEKEDYYINLVWKDKCIKYSNIAQFHPRFNSNLDNIVIQKLARELIYKRSEIHIFKLDGKIIQKYQAHKYWNREDFLDHLKQIVPNTLEYMSIVWYVFDIQEEKINKELNEI